MISRLIQTAKNQNGQAIVMVALTMTIILGAGALALDVSRAVAAATHLQTAADQAALAAATTLGEGDTTTQATTAAYQYLALNGVPTSDVTNITVSPDTGSATVTLASPFPFLLGPAIGVAGTTIDKTSTATLGGRSPFDYAIFSNNPLTLTAQFTVTGTIHSNSSVALQIGSGQSYATGGIEANGPVTVNQAAIPPYQAWMYNQIDVAKMGPVNPASTPVPMPDLQAQMLAQAQQEGHYITPQNWPQILPSTWNGQYDWHYSKGTGSGNGTWSVDGSDVTLGPGTWYFDGNVSLYPGGWGTDIDGAIFATGTISIGGGGLNANGPSNIVALYSASNSSQAIYLSCGGQTSLNGIIYAPNGTVSLNGQIPVINGAVIGNTVSASNALTINYVNDYSAFGLGPQLAYLTH